MTKNVYFLNNFSPCRTFCAQTLQQIRHKEACFTNFYYHNDLSCNCENVPPQIRSNDGPMCSLRIWVFRRVSADALSVFSHCCWEFYSFLTSYLVPRLHQLFLKLPRPYAPSVRKIQYTY